ncbi:flagellar hook protein FlgE [Flaviflagellibacter deserti]|jgi:flagellar hook protein FlgE|uniref:Flagellar hook protein FlgE n=1 Tax=Flaviflagellibacter deserti TaxID=2267266 RepID=A0ABV9Z753_9HYPH
MSLYGVLRTGVSGMNAQGNKLATTADNIANTNTPGYKRASTEFSTLVIGNSKVGNYMPSGVSTQTRYAISESGQIMPTSNGYDLAIGGSGFFIVQNAAGTPYLTRAGSFRPQPDGSLLNAGGYQLMGYDLANGPPTPVANSLAGLVPVNIYAAGMTATPTTEGALGAANLNSNAAIVDPATADTAGENTAASQYTNKTSLSVYDNLGNEVLLDVYFTKTAANTWEVSVYDRATATAGGFPYGAAGSAALYEGAITFSGTDGQFTGILPVPVSLTVPNGQVMTMDFTEMTQLASADFVPDPDVNGNKPQSVEAIEISNDGVVFAVFEDGTRLATYQLAMADVPSPDNLTPVAGNAYAISLESGDPSIGFPNSAGFGVIKSGALEQSNVDMAAELTAMIEAQRGYTANSKVFQTGSDLLDVLVNLKR